MLLLLEFMLDNGRESLVRPRSSAPTPDRSQERGASLVEYSLLVALIAVVCIGAVTYFGGELASTLSTSGGSIN